MIKKNMEVGDIFRKYGNLYLRKYGRITSGNQLKALNSIGLCRTAALGGHVDECNECGTIRISYNSCRNRHCPKCQTLLRERWLIDRKNELLPINYYHVVFTIPKKLNSIIYGNQKIGYKIFFDSVSQTLLELTKDSKYLGAKIGITSILHTWGQNLLYHPHIHNLVTGGGLTEDNKEWISAKDNFFIPVRVMSKLFQGKFLYNLKKSYEEEKFKFAKSNENLKEKKNFNELINSLYKENWVVYCKEPLKNAEAVIDYFGRYTHRVAISNYRIIKIENDKVYFKWKDYKENGKTKIMSLTAEEFIRRFLLHILPKKFWKIRYYGIMANCHRKKKLKICRQILNLKEFEEIKQKEKRARELLLKITGVDISICPVCKKGRMIHKKELPKCIHSPPDLSNETGRNIA
jgi:hypothetical protein